jgi:hypothetical protein
VIQQFYEYGCPSIRALSQLRKHCHFAVGGSIACFEVTVLQAATVLGGFGNVSMLFIGHGLLHFPLVT